MSGKYSLKRESSAKIIAISLLALLSQVKCYSDMATASDCATCLSDSSNYICKDNTVDTQSYCCGSTETSVSACKRDICSPSLQTTSMKLYTCPYETKVCGGVDPDRSATLNSSTTIATGSKFVQYSICYWNIKASDFSNRTTANANLSSITVTINSFSNVYLYINNGTSPKTAANQTTVEAFSSMTYTFWSNQIIYI